MAGHRSDTPARCPASPRSYMVATPKTLQDKQITRPEGTTVEWEGDDLASLTNHRTKAVLSENGPWLLDAYNSLRYYRGDQRPKNVRQADRNRISRTANFIRKNIDRQVSEVLDAEPQVNPSARHPKHTDFARLLLHVLDWTRDEEEDWEENQEDVISDTYHIGEGCLFEGWDAFADEGRGMPNCTWIDARYVLPDTHARTFQRDDGEFVIWLDDKKEREVKAMYPVLKDLDLTNDETLFDTHLRSGRKTGRSGENSGSVGRGSGGKSFSNNDDRVWVKRMWHKRHITEKHYWWEDDGSPATIIDGSDEIDVTEDNYDDLPQELKDQIVSTDDPTTEMWETVVVGDYVVEHRISPFDQSEGGHGKFPFCWFPCVRIRDESRARSEISYMIGWQDIQNESISALLDQMFMAGVGFLHSERGSMPPEEAEKVNRIGRDPLTHIETLPGLSPPEFRGYNTTGAALFSNVLPQLKQIADDINGLQDAARGQTPPRVQSGRAIRALQAQVTLLQTKTRRHIESGLKKATLLRLHNISQFMRGNRYITDIADPNDDRDTVLFIGFNEEEVAAVYNLQQVPREEDGEMEWQTEDGKPAKILVLNDEAVRDVVFNKIRLTLGSGKEQTKLEQMDTAETVLGAVGAPAIPWVAKEMDWHNADELIEAIQANDEAMALQAKLEDLSKQTRIPVPDLLQMLQSILSGGAGAGVPQGTPMGPPGPPPTTAPPTPAGPPGPGAAPPAAGVPPQLAGAAA